jgi:hypothetical protein
MPLSGAGDVNGDGYHDLMIGSSDAERNGIYNSGATYVAFGGDYGAYAPGVTAEVVDGVLQIVGDDQANSIRASTVGYLQVLVEGLDGTTINGLPEAMFEVSMHGITENTVTIAMGKGADSVILNNLATGYFFGRVLVDTGRGSDFIESDGGSTGLTIIAGNGDDHLVIRRSSEGQFDHLDADMGKGDDRVTLLVQNWQGAEGEVRLGKGDDVLDGIRPDEFYFGDMIADGGPGFDRFFRPLKPLFYDADNFEEEVDETFVGGDVTTEVVVDPDIGRILVVKGKDLFDHDVHLSSTAFGQVTLDSLGYGATINGLAASASFNDIARVKVVLGSGTDSVRTSLMLSNKLIVKTGLGNDNVEIVGGQLGKLKIDTGGGADTVLLDSVTVDRRTKIFTRWGEDEVTIRDSVFGRKVFLEGGLDEDTLELIANEFAKGYEEDFEL